VGLVFQIHSRLEDLPGACGGIFEAQHDFSLSREWFRNMVANGLPGDIHARFGVLMDGSSAIGIIPLQENDAAELSSLTNCYTCIYRPLIAPQAPDEAAHLLGSALGSFCASRPLVRIECLPLDWVGLEAFVSGLRMAGLSVRRFNQFGNWYEPMQGRSWDAYLALRPGSLRELLRRRRRMLRMGEISCEIMSGADAISRGLEAYEAVYCRSWKPSEPFPRFNPELMRAAARLGSLRLGICWRAHRPIAAQLWILARGTATVMKLAHDEAHRSLSPGTLLTAAAIERFVDEGITELDFGRGDDSYKQLWSGQRRQRIGLILANGRMSKGLATLVRHDFARLVRIAQRKLGGRTLSI
jgi:Acetyltransferase (GNAT) domain